MNRCVKCAKYMEMDGHYCLDCESPEKKAMRLFTGQKLYEFWNTTLPFSSVVQPVDWKDLHKHIQLKWNELAEYINTKKP